MSKFRTILSVVDAIQFKGDRSSVWEIIDAFDPDENIFDFMGIYLHGAPNENARLTFNDLTAYTSDWIVRDSDGTLSICEASVFEKRYEEIS